MHWQPAKLCVSIEVKSLSQLEEVVQRCPQADLFELRLDRAPDIDFTRIRNLIARPLIVTARIDEQGGHWQGPSKRRIPLFQSALDAGINYIDLEWPYASQLLSGLQLKAAGQVVLSHHTQENDPGKLRHLFREMTKIPAGVYKLVFRADHLNDNLTAWLLLEYAAARGVKCIVHAMGEAGQLSRLIGAIMGNAWTYTAVESAVQTASGQLTLNEAANGYYLAEKSPGAMFVGLLGYPVEQSKGWRLHNQLLHIQKEKNRPVRDFLYVNFPVQDFSDFWEKWQDRVMGFSITIPYKQKMVTHLNAVSGAVRLSGVCNTAVKRKGKWWGFNTDLLAMTGLLKPHQTTLQEGCLIIGTGATARSAIGALHQLQVWKIYVTGRNVAEGKNLQRQFGVTFLDQENINHAKTAGIIQATPVGMYPAADALPPGVHLLRNGMIVLDVVYNPVFTRLLQLARERGCVTISGVEMFLRQAAMQFEIFSGMSVSIEEVGDVWRQVQETRQGPGS